MWISLRLAGFRQPVTLNKNTTYTFSAYVNTSTLTGIGSNALTDGAYIMITGQGVTQKSEIIHYKTNAEIEGGWKRVSVTYRPTVTGTYYLEVRQSGVLGVSSFDDVQLEIGDTMSNVNLIQDGSFDRNTGTTYWSGGSRVASGSTIHQNVMKLVGSLTGTQRVSQTVQINQPGDTTFLLSAWGKADSVFFASKDDSTT